MFRYNVVLADKAGKRHTFICYGSGAKEAEAMAFEMAKVDKLEELTIEQSYRETASFVQ